MTTPNNAVLEIIMVALPIPFLFICISAAAVFGWLIAVTFCASHLEKINEEVKCLYRL